MRHLDERVWRLRFGALVLGFLSGCGHRTEPRRVAVHGSVIAADQLVSKGTIRFLPEAGTPGTAILTSVHDGLYSFTNRNGPFPGKYKVIVNLELSLEDLAKMSRAKSSGPAPPVMWEDEATLPDEDTATRHFIWTEEDDEEQTTDTSTQKSHDKPTP